MSISGIECAFIGRLGRTPNSGTARPASHGSRSPSAWARTRTCSGSKPRCSTPSTKAEDLARTLHKGVALYVEGRDLKIDRWTGQDGQQRAELNCIATRVEVLGQIGERRPPKPKAPADGEQPARAAPVSGPADYQRPIDGAGGGRRQFDDQIPFGPEVR
jgi:hypothetical protein